MQPTTLQSEYYKEIFKVNIFQGRTSTRKKNLSSRERGFEPTTLCDLVRCSNHRVTQGDSMVSNGEMC